MKIDHIVENKIKYTDYLCDPSFLYFYYNNQIIKRLNLNQST